MPRDTRLNGLFNDGPHRLTRLLRVRFAGITHDPFLWGPIGEFLLVDLDLVFQSRLQPLLEKRWRLHAHLSDILKDRDPFRQHNEPKDARDGGRLKLAGTGEGLRCRRADVDDCAIAEELGEYAAEPSARDLLARDDSSPHAGRRVEKDQDRRGIRDISRCHRDGVVKNGGEDPRETF